MKKGFVFSVVLINFLFFPLTYADNTLTGEQINITINQLDQITRLINQAEQGNTTAQYKLAQMYNYGLGIERNDVESKKWYTKAAEQGHINAQLDLANVYYRGRNGEKINYLESLKWFQLAADQGSAEGQYNLGEMYAKGQGVEQDTIVAIKWYKLAANQNYSEAQYQLGYMNFYGEGIQQNYSEAVKWFKLAAKLGNDKAQSKLGYMYCTGDGVMQDLAEAERWVSLPNDGIAFGFYSLGTLYFNGRCGEKDYIRAAKLFELSAQKGNLLAQHMLGYMYSQGLGVTQSTTKATQWYKKACENGFQQDCVSDEK